MVIENSKKERNTQSDIALWVTLFFIVISPFENLARIERIYYAIGIIILLGLIVIRRSIRINSGLLWIVFLVYLFFSCFWSPNKNALSGYFLYAVVLLFLVLQLQFDYTQEGYEKIKTAFVIQGAILSLLCTGFGSYMDGRLWLKTTASGADPNYLSGWFVFPLVFCIEKMMNKEIKTIWKVLMAIEIIVSFYFIMQTASRAGVIANAAVLMLAVLYSIKDNLRFHPLRAVILVFIMIAGFYAMMRFMPAYTMTRLLRSTGMGDRGKNWKELIEALNSHFYGWLVGMGFGSVQEFNSFHMAAHNTFLDIFFFVGIAGFSFMFRFMYVSIKRIYRMRPYTFIGTIAMSMLAFTLSAFTTRFFMLMLFLIGANVVNNGAEDSK